MKVKMIRIGRAETMRVPGHNYETLRPSVDMEAEVEEGESFGAVFKQLSLTVNSAWDTEAAAQLESFLNARKK